MRRRRNDDRILALGLTLLLAITLLPTTNGQIPHLTIEPIGETTAKLDTSHLVHRFRFRVTNNGDALDYVTIPRTETRWTDNREAVAGFPSPEFGLSLAPGASGEMWVSVDPVRPTQGTRSADVPFRSELTGATTTQRVTIVVGPAPAPTTRLVIRTDPPSATVEATDLTATTQPGLRTQPSPGATTIDVPPGLYAIRADATGRQGATRIVRIPGDPTEITLTLPPARWSATASDLTRASADESAWTLAGSQDLNVLVTMPMVHQQPNTEGRGVGFRNGARTWTASFPGPQGAHNDAGPFQALDTTAAVSPDGTLAALFDWNGIVRVVDADDGTPRWTTNGGTQRHPLYPPNSNFGEGYFTSGAVAFSPNGTHLAAGGSNGRLTLHDAATGTKIWERAYSAEIRALHFTRDGGLVIGSGDWQLHMLNATTGQTRWTSHEPEFWPFFFITESADGTRIATGGKDSNYRVFDTRTGTLLHQFPTGYAFITSGTIGTWGGTYSDWGYGVRAFDTNGDITWFRRLPQAIATTTHDGRFTLTAWYQPDQSTSGLTLLDDTGTTLWTTPPDIHTPCTSTASPFPPKQWKTLLLHQPQPNTIRYAAACIGGGVITGTLTTQPQDTTTPPSNPTPTHPPPTRTPDTHTPERPNPPPATTDNPNDAAPTPTAAWLAAGALVAAAIAWPRRGRPG